MNKRTTIFSLLVVLLVVGAIAGRKFIAPEACTNGEGETVTINMRSLKNQWTWEPNPVHVTCGNTVVLNIYNEDTNDHGFALDVYGINKRLPPEATTTITFKATNKGEFVFYCSVPCGPGHFEQKGKMIVGEIVDQ